MMSLTAMPDRVFPDKILCTGLCSVMIFIPLKKNPDGLSGGFIHLPVFLSKKVLKLFSVPVGKKNRVVTSG